jgi:hypothetical protein
MADRFFDTGAAAKRYRVEVGTAEVDALPAEAVVRAVHAFDTEGEGGRRAHGCRTALLRLFCLRWGGYTGHG